MSQRVNCDLNPTRLSQISQKSKLSQESALFGEDMFEEIKNEVSGLENLLDGEFADNEGTEAEAVTKLKLKTKSKDIRAIVIGEVNQMPKEVENETNEYPHIGCRTLCNPIVETLEEYPGNYNFQLLLNTFSKGCLYSPMLQKLFIDMDHKFPVRFQWDVNEKNNDQFQLRAFVIFTQDHQRNDPVERCLNHKAITLPCNQNVDENILKHVVRCDDPNAVYENNQGFLSIVVPISPVTPVNFQFYCKNSCSSGMNRRETSIIFNLETLSGQVVGRRVLLIRICSCPKRDKTKEENEMKNPQGKTKKLIFTNENKSSAVKRTHSQNEYHEYTVKIKVPNKKLKNLIMESAFNIISGDAIKNNSYQLLTPYLNEIYKQLESHS